MGIFLKKVHFLKTVEAKVMESHHTSLVLVQPRKNRPYITERLLMGRKESNQTNKQKHQHVKTVSSETTRPFELKFHMKVSYDRLAKIYTNCTGHMAKMAATPIYGKNPLNIFFSATKRPMALGLCM